MALLRRRKQPAELAFEAYGVGVVVEVEDPELAADLQPMLPPANRPCEPAEDMPRLSLRRDAGSGFDVIAGAVPVATSLDREVAMRVLAAQIRAEVALRSPRGIFVHAGAVGQGGRAILLPGPSFSGKTTLVAALVRAGATYYSDEFAVLDAEGRVHPYPKPLSLRAEGARWGEETAPGELGGAPGEAPLPVGLIAITTYRPGKAWRPEHRSTGQGAIALVANAVPARHRPDRVMSSARLAAEDALVLEGDRGEADAVASDLLARAGHASSEATPTTRRRRVLPSR